MSAGDRYKVGMLVRHPLKPDWGLGKVLAVNDREIQIHFKDDRDQDSRRISIERMSLDIAEIQSDPALDNLPEFRQNGFCATSRRVTFADGVRRFFEEFPRGFLDSRYFEMERNYKWAAHERFAHEFGNGKGVEALETGQVQDVSRSALSIASLNLLSAYEMMALSDGLKADLNVAKQFFQTLFDVVEEPPNRGSFERLVRVLGSLRVEPGKARVATWPVLTIFLYLARPDRFMFLKPQPTKDCADRLRFELHYSADLRWITYASLMTLSNSLLDRLREHGARDLIDVQSFMWVVAKY